MNWGRYFLSLSVAALLTLIADVVLNAVIFRDVYARSASLFLPMNELNARVWLGWAALVMIVAAYGFFVVRGGWLGIRQGLQFGLVLTVASIGGVAGLASLFAWPTDLLAVLGVQQVVNGVLLGVVFGTLYRPRRIE